MQGALLTLARHTPPPSNKRQTTFSSIYVHLSRSPHKCKNEKIFYVVTEHFEFGLMRAFQKAHICLMLALGLGGDALLPSRLKWLG